MPEATTSEILQRQSFLLVESSIPPHLTLDEWRRRRGEAPRSRLHRALGAARRARKQVHRLALME